MQGAGNAGSRRRMHVERDLAVPGRAGLAAGGPMGERSPAAGRLDAVVIDTDDPGRLAEFYGETLATVFDPDGNIVGLVFPDPGREGEKRS